MFELRPYQGIAIDRVNTAWTEGMQRPAVVLPTGAGKTVVFSRLIDGWHKANPGRRAVVIVHREELITQTVKQLRTHAPGVGVGVVKAASDETDEAVVVASVQTLAVKGRAERLTDVGIVIVDECHHYAAKSWKDVLTRLRCFEDDGPRVVGFTATLSRGDGKGLGGVWEDVVYRRDILRMIMDGYLCDVRALSVKVDGLDLARVSRKAGGDFSEGPLGDAMIAANAQEAVVKAYAEHAADRQAIAFAPNVAFAHAMATALDGAGVKAEVVTGTTPTEERIAIYDRFRDGTTRVLCNCMVLTEGFDAPWAEVAIVARPTTNGALYTQIVGRVLRSWPGKKDALVLDLCGASDTLTVSSLVDLSDEAIAPKDGESLVEALERVRRTAKRTGGTVPLADMTASQADMFAKQSGAWLLTDRRHTPFIRTTTATYFLWPLKGTDTYMIGRFDNKGDIRRTGRWMKEGGWVQGKNQAPTALPLEYALAWADGEAVDADPSIAGRTAPWRRAKKGAKSVPTPAQLGFAASLGIDTTDMTKSMISDAINVKVVTRALGG